MTRQCSGEITEPVANSGMAAGVKGGRSLQVCKGEENRCVCVCSETDVCRGYDTVREKEARNETVQETLS